jgi:hypothetical protein
MCSANLSIFNLQSSVKFLLFMVTIILLLIVFNEPAMAQCPMCKASAEASIKGGSSVAKGLNKGILYLLMMPYVLFSVIFLLWYKNYRKTKVVVS